MRKSKSEFPTTQTPKKRGRPAGVKNKPAPVPESQWVNTTKLNNAVIESQRRQIDSLLADIKGLNQAVTNLKIDVLDQAAVINYLEKKLEKKNEA